MRIHSSWHRNGFSLGIIAATLALLLFSQHRNMPRAAAQTPTKEDNKGVKQASYIPAATSNSGEVVAYIFGTIPITREELGEYLVERMGPERLNNLVNRRIIQQAAQEKGIEVTAAEIEADLAETVHGMAPTITMKDFEQKILKPRNKTLYEWKEDVIRPKLLLSKMCKDKVKVTEKDLHDAFEAYYGEKVDCKIILWPKDQKHVALSTYPKIRESEEEFDRVARSQASPTLCAQGGRLQPIGRHTTGNEVLEKAIFGLQANEMTEVLETPEGYLVAKCVKRIPPDASKHLDDVREKLSAEIYRRRLEMEEVPRMFRELRDKADPKIVMKHEVSEEELTRDVRESLKTEDSKSKKTAK
jgi:hypothetical protein